ncbi:MAG: hypothetical protein R3D98_06025 [Candidatus Krumholzibacteriia bacterium]
MAKLPPSEHDDVRPRNKRRYDGGERRETEGPVRGAPRKPTRPPADEDDWEFEDDDDFDDELEVDEFEDELADDDGLADLDDLPDDDDDL